MSNHINHRRGDHTHRTEHGPTFENRNPGKGCNSKHVAKSRRDWKKIKNRSLRRNGKITPKYWDIKPTHQYVFYDDELNYDE